MKNNETLLNRIVAAACLILSFHCLSVFALDLECDIIASTWNINSEGTSCFVENLNITTQNQLVTSVNGQSAAEFQGQGVNGFFSIEQTINYMPKGLDKFFPNLELIQIYNSKLKSIVKSDLASFSTSKTLFLPFNEIETLSSNLLSNNLQLYSIDLNSNKLATIGEKTFETLAKLEQLNVSNNLCIDSHTMTKEDIPALLDELKQKCSQTKITTTH